MKLFEDRGPARGSQPGRGRRGGRAVRLAGLLLLAGLALFSACSGVEGLLKGIPLLPATPSPTAPPQATPTPGPTAAAVTPTRVIEPPGEMIVWLPPEFNPQGTDRAAALLRGRLAEFEQQKGVKIEVRLKAASGASGLLESLSAASAAAPLALPAVVALSRPDLEAAALKGLLIPLDGLSAAIDDPDWYPYARELALVQGVTFGLPFAGDGLALAYRPAKIPGGLASWEDVLSSNQGLAFAAASPLGLTTVALYRSVGGEVEDAQRRPILQTDHLAEVFELYRSGAVRGVFPAWLTGYETDAQVWQAYADGRVNACLTWTSTFMKARLPDSLISPLPALGSQPSTLASGWAWAVADPLPERRQLSAQLAEWLAAPEFLAAWSEAAGVLPTRPSEFDAWQDVSLKTVLGQVALTAHARPSTDLLTSLGPVLEEATLKVIRLEAEPSQAAAQAAERLANPESR